MTAPSPSRGPVAIVAAAGTLVDLESSLRAMGVPSVRFDALRFVPSLSAARRRAIRRTRWDGIIVSSPRGIELFLAPVFGRARDGAATPAVFVAGESTATRTARLGYPAVRPTGAPGIRGILGAVPNDRRLRLLHPRSDVAGPSMARALRAAGHTVHDVVAFRTRAAARMSPATRRGLAGASIVVVTSPSALRSLRRHLGRVRFRALADHVPFRALGETTAAAVRRAGVRDVALLDLGPGQAFTPVTVTSLFDGRRPAH
ncbi:MAG: uroporphyrinogen-III synthase [Thermoplasmata archaeon]|nr:uroporphyrinogen-III synthase [Thermoplasmata archaeon]